MLGFCEKLINWQGFVDKIMNIDNKNQLILESIF